MRAKHNRTLALSDTDHRIKLPVFEGPLDLLLFLIRKHELDIHDIPVESVTKQYIAVLRSMEQLDLEVAGEFFVMAATLMEIKSRMLLPRGEAAVDPNAEDDGLDPRWELVNQLLQYKKFKDAAARLNDLAVAQRDQLARHVSTLSADRALLPVGRLDLWTAFNLVLRRIAEKLVVGEIEDEHVTVAGKMEELLALTREKKSFVFSSLFDGPISIRTLVATFLAVLELTRLRRLTVRQDEAFTDIVCTARDEEPPVGSDGEKPLETPAEAATLAS